MFKDKQLESDINYILDTFTGGDGGISFIKFKVLIEHLDQKDDEAAREIIRIVRRFVRLIETAQKEIL